MEKLVLYFNEIDKTSLPYVGGKGADLGELSKAGFDVPEGFCITTEAYSNFINTSPEMEGYFKLLDEIDTEKIDDIRKLGERIRSSLETITIPESIKESVVGAWKATGESYAYAVRSSATAEDLPTASFAGQQDTYLNIKGEEEIVRHVQKCWASLFTDRAIAYRSKNGFDHRKVRLSVVVQRMIQSEVSGIMFTADPVTGHRKTVSIDASFGLGEALVSGLVSADLFQVKANEIIMKQIGEKKIAIFSDQEGGTVKKELPLNLQNKQALSDEQIIKLAQVGQKIEQHYGSPQDIEWGLLENKLYILQSRPITSLYPSPTAFDNRLHVYFSFGHQQMMTEAMKPMAISVLRTFFPFGNYNLKTLESNVMIEAGGHLYVDLTDLFNFKPMKKVLPKILNNLDELISNAISDVINREEFLQGLKPNKNIKKAIKKTMLPILLNIIKNVLFRDPKQAIQKNDVFIEKIVKKYKNRIENIVGAERVKVIQEDLGSILLHLIQNIFPYPVAGIISMRIMETLSKKWLGGTKEVAELNKSLHGNVTSEMGLVIGDLADVVRTYPEIINYIQHVNDDTFYKDIEKVNGGDKFKIELDSFIAKYGMRCPGEIDITNQRWREVPTHLMPAILGHIRSTETGDHRKRFKDGELEAEKAAESLISKVRQTRGGYFKAKIMTRLISVARNLAGIREHPKYAFIQIFDNYRKALLEEANNLVYQDILKETEDVYYLTLSELSSILEDNFTENVEKLISERKEEFERYQKLKPPRVMTSDGEIVIGNHNISDAPKGALIGTPVSAGIIEGRARIVLKPEEAKLEKGEILVAPFTDPGWTPLFLSAQGLIMEVGGVLTHGAVVAREYGIPAVVGVENATKNIKDGQLIRVNGDRGFIEMLEENSSS